MINRLAAFIKKYKKRVCFTLAIIMFITALNTDFFAAAKEGVESVQDDLLY